MDERPGSRIDRAFFIKLRLVQVQGDRGTESPAEDFPMTTEPIKAEPSINATEVVDRGLDLILNKQYAERRDKKV